MRVCVLPSIRKIEFCSNKSGTSHENHPKGLITQIALGQYTLTSNKFKLHLVDDPHQLSTP